MGMIPGAGGAASVPQFSRVLYVSPGFANASPTFNTLANAYAACDGVTPTLIWVGPGTYTEQVTAKENTYLVGLDRHAVLINGTNGVAISCTSNNANRTFGFFNLTVYADGGATVGMCFNVVFNADGLFKLYNCDIGFAPGGAINAYAGVNVQTPRSSATVEIVDCSFGNQNTVNASHIRLPNGSAGWTPSNFRVQRCFFLAGAFFIGAGTPIAGGMEFQDCVFDCTVNVALSAVGDIQIFRNCVFRGQVVSTFAGTQGTAIFQGCTFDGVTNTVLVTNGVMQLFFQNCTWIYTSADQTAFSLTAGTGGIRLDSCSITNGKIVFSYVGTGILSLVNCTIRNAGGALSLDSGANVMTFRAFNLTTDKPLGANITVLAGGVNNNINVNI